MTLQDVLSERAKWSQRAHEARERVAKARDRVDKANAALCRAEERADLATRQVYDNAGPRALVDRIAGLLAPHFPDQELETSGPFGIGCTCTIYLIDPNYPGAPEMRTAGMLQFRASDDGMALVDHTVDTGQFPANSLGRMNGLNHPERDMPETVEELAALLRKDEE